MRDLQSATRRPIGAAGLSMLLAFSIRPAAAETFVTDLPLEIGSQRLLYAAPANPRAALLMLPGSNGMVEIGTDGSIRRMNRNFLIRTLPLWQAQGFAVAVVTPPIGIEFSPSEIVAFDADRAQMAHDFAAGSNDIVRRPPICQFLGQAVDFVHGRANLPVWLVGTSQGATAAIGGGARLGDRIAGVVVASSVTGRNSSGETLFDAEPGLVAVPVFIVANTGDGCPASPPDAAIRIAEALARAPRKEIVYMQSTASEDPPCEAMSPHGYFGVEEATVARIADWIRTTTGR